MKRWKLIGIGVGIAAVAFFSRALVGQQSNGVSANDRNGNPQSLPSKVALPLPPETAIVPAGAKIAIQLQETISAGKNSPEGRFTATLRGPLIVNEKLLAHSRCKIIGQITNSEEPGRFQGRAKLAMVLRKLIVDGKEYDLETELLTLATRSATKEEAAIMAGSTAEETIGAIAGITDRGKDAVIGPESRFTFTLSGPLELPVIRTMGNAESDRRPSYTAFLPSEKADGK